MLRFVYLRAEVSHLYNFHARAMKDDGWIGAFEAYHIMGAAQWGR